MCATCVGRPHRRDGSRFANLRRSHDRRIEAAQAAKSKNVDFCLTDSATGGVSVEMCARLLWVFRERHENLVRRLQPNQRRVVIRGASLFCRWILRTPTRGMLQDDLPSNWDTPHRNDASYCSAADVSSVERISGSSGIRARYQVRVSTSNKAVSCEVYGEDSEFEELHVTESVRLSFHCFDFVVSAF